MRSLKIVLAYIFCKTRAELHRSNFRRGYRCMTYQGDWLLFFFPPTLDPASSSSSPPRSLAPRALSPPFYSHSLDPSNFPSLVKCVDSSRTRNTRRSRSLKEMSLNFGRSQALTPTPMLESGQGGEGSLGLGWNGRGPELLTWWLLGVVNLWTIV